MFVAELQAAGNAPDSFLASGQVQILICQFEVLGFELGVRRGYCEGPTLFRTIQKWLAWSFFSPLDNCGWDRAFPKIC